MDTTRKFIGALSSALLAALCLHGTASHAQTYPSKPISLVVPMAAGNAADVTARLISQRLSHRIGQQIVVENRPGAGGVTAVKMVANAAPDGHTLLYAGMFAPITQNLFKPAPYDLLRDFVPVATTSGNDILVLVSSDSKHRTLADLLRAASESKDSLMCGVSLLGSGQHMGAELFKQRAHAKITIVPYRTASNLHAALRGGDLDCAFEYIPSMLKLIQAGGIRALAVGSEKRTELFPEVPTIMESGVPDYVVSSWIMLAAPAGTPDAIVQRLNAETRAVLAEPDVKERLKSMGIRVVSGDAAYARDLMSKEIVRWGEVIRAGGIELK